MSRTSHEYEHIAKLVKRAQRGDQAAFEEAYRLTAQPQYFTLLSKVGADVANDLLQEVYLAVWAHLADIRPRAFVGYVNSVTRNVLLRHYEKSNRKKETAPGQDKLVELVDGDQQSATSATQASTADPAHAATRRDESQRLAEALRTCLDDRERNVVLMRYYHRMPVAAIAEQIDVSASTVKRILNQALEKLRSHLGFLPFGASLAALMEQAVDTSLAPGVSGKPPQRSALDSATRITAGLLAAASVACVAFAIAPHESPAGASAIESMPANPTPLAAPYVDTEAPYLTGTALEGAQTVLTFSDESGIAKATLTAENGTICEAEHITQDDAGTNVYFCRFSVPSGIYDAYAADGLGNEAVGTITVTLPEDA